MRNARNVYPKLVMYQYAKSGVGNLWLASQI